MSSRNDLIRAARSRLREMETERAHIVALLAVLEGSEGEGNAPGNVVLVGPPTPQGTIAPPSNTTNGARVNVPARNPFAAKPGSMRTS